MRKGPALVLGALALVFLVVIVVTLAGNRGEDATVEGGVLYPDLSAIPTAEKPDSTPETIDVSKQVETTTGPDGPDGPGGCQAETYLAVSGDNPSSIAADHGISLAALVEANPGILDRLDIGQEVTIPCPPTPIPTATPSSTETPDPNATPDTGEPTDEPTGSTINYEVQAGDTAGAIATQFGVTLEELAAANNTSVDALSSLNVGQILKIPNQ